MGKRKKFQIDTIVSKKLAVSDTSGELLDGKHSPKKTAYPVARPCLQFEKSPRKNKHPHRIKKSIEAEEKRSPSDKKLSAVIGASSSHEDGYTEEMHNDGHFSGEFGNTCAAATEEIGSKVSALDVDKELNVAHSHSSREYGRSLLNASTSAKNASRNCVSSNIEGLHEVGKIQSAKVTPPEGSSTSLPTNNELLSRASQDKIKCESVMRGNSKELCTKEIETSDQMETGVSALTSSEQNQFELISKELDFLNMQGSPVISELHFQHRKVSPTKGIRFRKTPKKAVNSTGRLFSPAEKADQQKSGPTKKFLSKACKRIYYGEVKPKSSKGREDIINANDGSHGTSSDTEDFDIDRRLEERAAKYDLTAVNVKSIINHIIKNKDVLAMVQNTMKADAAEEAVFTPKLTRLKTKEIQEKGQLAVPSLLAAKPSTSNVPTVITAQFSETESSDEEYNPDLDVQSVDSDDESVTSSKASDIDSPLPHSSFQQRFSVPCENEENFDEVASSKPKPANHLPIVATPMGPPPAPSSFSIPNTESEDNPTYLTRSKHSLTDVPIAALESNFVAPDCTPDLYEPKYDDDEDSAYLELLAALKYEASPDNHNESVDEDDPEYNVMEEEEVEDREDYCFNKASEISKKEFRELMESLSEILEEEYGTYYDNELMPTVNYSTEPFQPMSVAQQLQPMNVAQPVQSTSVDSTNVSENILVSTEYNAKSSDENLDNNKHGEAATKECTGEPKASKGQTVTESHGITVMNITLPVSFVPNVEVLPLVTVFQREQIHDQMRKHVQLIVQLYLLATEHRRFSQQEFECRQMLIELQENAVSSVAGLGQSAFAVCNLNEAADIIFERGQYSAEDEDVSVKPKCLQPLKTFPRRTDRGLSKRTIVTLSESKVFIYPELVPNERALDISEIKRHKTTFIEPEDNLISMGLERYSENLYMVQKMLPTKTVQQIRLRIKNLSTTKAKDNPIKYFRKYKKAPDFPRDALLPFFPSQVIPLCQRLIKPAFYEDYMRCSSTRLLTTPASTVVVLDCTAKSAVPLCKLPEQRNCTLTEQEPFGDKKLPTYSRAHVLNTVKKVKGIKMKLKKPKKAINLESPKSKIVPVSHVATDTNQSKEGVCMNIGEAVSRVIQSKSYELTGSSFSTSLSSHLVDYSSSDVDTDSSVDDMQEYVVASSPRQSSNAGSNTGETTPLCSDSLTEISPCASCVESQPKELVAVTKMQLPTPMQMSCESLIQASLSDSIVTKTSPCSTLGTAVSASLDASYPSLPESSVSKLTFSFPSNEVTSTTALSTLQNLPTVSAQNFNCNIEYVSSNSSECTSQSQVQPSQLSTSPATFVPPSLMQLGEMHASPLESRNTSPYVPFNVPSCIPLKSLSHSNEKCILESISTSPMKQLQKSSPEKQDSSASNFLFNQASASLNNSLPLSPSKSTYSLSFQQIQFTPPKASRYTPLAPKPGTPSPLKRIGSPSYSPLKRNSPARRYPVTPTKSRLLVPKPKGLVYISPVKKAVQILNKKRGRPFKRKKSKEDVSDENKQSEIAPSKVRTDVVVTENSSPKSELFIPIQISVAPQCTATNIIQQMMTASTTVHYGRKSGLAAKREKRNKKQVEVETTLSMMAPDLIESDPKREVRDTLVARNYLTRVREKLLPDQEQIYEEFLQIIYDFSLNGPPCHGCPVKLYKELSKLLQDHEELLLEFADFLTPFQACQCGLLQQQQEYEQARLFLRKLEVHFQKLPSHFQKIVKVLLKYRHDLISRYSELRDAVKPMLKSHPHLLEEFSQFFPEERPPDRLMTSCEDIKLDDGDDENSDLCDPQESFEEIYNPDLGDDYGGKKCRCKCHENTTDVKFLSRAKHCTPCSTRYIDGHMYIRLPGVKGLQLAKIIYHKQPDESKTTDEKSRDLIEVQTREWKPNCELPVTVAVDESETISELSSGQTVVVPLVTKTTDASNTNQTNAETIQKSTEIQICDVNIDLVSDKGQRPDNLLEVMDVSPSGAKSDFPVHVFGPDYVRFCDVSDSKTQEKDISCPTNSSAVFAKNVTVDEYGQVLVVWTREDDREILQCVQNMGPVENAFKLLAQKFEGKTPEQVKNRFEELVKLYEEMPADCDTTESGDDST